MSEFRPLRFNDASIRANELVANTKLGIGTHSQGHPLAIAKEGTVYTSISDTSAGTDAKHWWTSVAGNQMTHYLANDLNNASQPYMKINRSGYNVDSITFDYGKVGIGTASPSHAFNVKATSGDAEVHIEAQGNAGDAILYFNGSPTNQRKCAILSSNVSPASWCKQDLHFCHNTSSNYDDVTIADSKMVITNGGNVGIGTTSPLEKLDVYGVGRMSSAYPRLDFFCTTGRSTNDWGNSTGAAGDYRIYSNSDASDATKRSLNFDYGQNAVHTTRMCINAAGHVGIGISQPETLTHVYVSNSTQSSSGLAGSFIETDGTSSSFYHFQTATGSGRVFGISNTGVAYADGGHGGAQADYAEMFEWLDGNLEGEDRTGYTVALQNEKIVIADDETPENSIIGIVSANPVVLGNNPMLNWHGRWLRDELNRYQMEEYDAWTWCEDGSTGEPRVVHVDDIELENVPENAVKIVAKRRVLNPNYDASRDGAYVARSERKEWSAVGLLGRLRLRKGQRTRSTWYKIRDVSDVVEEWFVR